MDQDYIDGLSLENAWDIILYRMLKDSLDGIEQPHWWLDESGSTFYQKIKTQSGLTKPTKTSMEAELEVIRSEYQLMLTQVNAEKQRIDDWFNRFDALENQQQIMVDLGLDSNNYEWYKHYVTIKLKDEQLLIDMENQHPITKQKIDNLINIDSYKSMGQIGNSICLSIINLINGINANKPNLSDTEYDNLIQTYNPVMVPLQMGHPQKAYERLVGISVDGVVMTQSEKDLIQGEFEKLLGI